MNIVVLGGTGMLGQAVCRFFDKKQIVYVNFKKRFTSSGAEAFVSELTTLDPDFIINCIGAIPQKYTDSESFFELNVALPQCLNSVKNATIIQPSTDCIFNAQPKSDLEFPGSNDQFNATDLYGFSKGVGDFLLNTSKSVIVRSSIIGLTEGSTGHGLLDWAIQNKDQKINGFSNHYWNGLTTDTWIGWVYANIILKPTFDNPIVHIGATKWVSKYNLLNIISDVFNLGLQIKKVETLEVADRRLSLDYEIGSVEEMLDHTKQFWT